MNQANVEQLAIDTKQLQNSCFLLKLGRTDYRCLTTSRLAGQFTIWELYLHSARDSPELCLFNIQFRLDLHCCLLPPPQDFMVQCIDMYIHIYTVRPTDSEGTNGSVSLGPGRGWAQNWVCIALYTVQYIERESPFQIISSWAQQKLAGALYTIDTYVWWFTPSCWTLTSRGQWKSDIRNHVRGRPFGVYGGYNTGRWGWGSGPEFELGCEDLWSSAPSLLPSSSHLLNAARQQELSSLWCSIIISRVGLPPLTD